MRARLRSQDPDRDVPLPVARPLSAAPRDARRRQVPSLSCSSRASLMRWLAAAAWPSMQLA